MKIGRIQLSALITLVTNLAKFLFSFSFLCKFTRSIQCVCYSKMYTFEGFVVYICAW